MNVARSSSIRDREWRNLERWPEPWRAFAELGRWDRPIGAWLLFWPCAWSVALVPAPVHWWYLLLFALGAFVMRSAGCTVNDLVDRKLDAQVERTRNRPLASERLSPIAALAFLAANALIGLGVLICFNVTTIVIGLASVPLILVYPFMKRITYWPQAFLGITFNWGALVGWTSIAGELQLPALLLYLAGIAWTLGYDTIYAHQDKEDDALIGIKSTALRLGKASRHWIIGFYLAFLGLLAVAGLAADRGLIFLMGTALVGLAAWRLLGDLDVDDGDDCLAKFRANRELGLIVFLVLIVSRLEI
ncbi:MAG: 4-hydroxybenzoate octaprenyltransferase [Geminicoccaceae bacterium]